MIFMTDWHGSTYCSLIIGGAQFMRGPFSKTLGGAGPPGPPRIDAPGPTRVRDQCNILLLAQCKQWNLLHFDSQEDAAVQGQLHLHSYSIIYCPTPLHTFLNALVREIAFGKNVSYSTVELIPSITQKEIISDLGVYKIVKTLQNCINGLNIP